MKIAVVAASGKVGRKVVNEAAVRGFEVTAFVRRAVDIDGAAKVVVKDIFELVWRVDSRNSSNAFNDA